MGADFYANVRCVKIDSDTQIQLSGGTSTFFVEVKLGDGNWTEVGSGALNDGTSPPPPLPHPSSDAS